jgi:hypothetical protein
MAGKPNWRVVVNKTREKGITYVCGSYRVEGGALVLSNARMDADNPNVTSDVIVLPLTELESAFLNFIGPA